MNKIKKKIITKVDPEYHGPEYLIEWQQNTMVLDAAWYFAASWYSGAAWYSAAAWYSGASWYSGATCIRLFRSGRGRQCRACAMRRGAPRPRGAPFRARLDELIKWGKNDAVDLEKAKIDDIWVMHEE